MVVAPKKRKSKITLKHSFGATTIVHIFQQYPFWPKPMCTWWLIPLSKWVITPVINGISRVNPLQSLGWTNPLTSRGMGHQVYIYIYMYPLKNRMWSAMLSIIPSKHANHELILMELPYVSSSLSGFLKSPESPQSKWPHDHHTELIQIHQTRSVCIEVFKELLAKNFWSWKMGGYLLCIYIYTYIIYIYYVYIIYIYILCIYI